ncbi:conserved hypothetical protein [Lebetimonas natsushimae]|uniref:Uncharacterized protein n=1 Tax=Lebetimonas natsushimae TaxID=1936991 RepID=A0A292YBR2_9BACT|nr:hypothetical protein [Lebetimonas natsushimae]GAX87208.1 conserved hypothetical protein [Lebetimonas natsushimae]
MKKLILIFPLFLFSYYYPFDYQFKFIHACEQSSSLPDKYNYCKCVFEKIKARYPYNFFIWHQKDKDVLNFIAKVSKECLNKKEVSY